MRILIGAIVVAVVLGGCAGYDWQKAGVSADQLTADKELCDRQARHLVNEYEFAFPGPGSWRQPYDPTRGFPADRMGEEQRLYSACMRSRGYELVKDDAR